MVWRRLKGKHKSIVTGLFLTTDEFSSLLYQLDKIEKLFKREEQGNSALQPNVCRPTSSKRKADSINNNNEDQRTTGPHCKVYKVDDAIKKWHVSKVKSIIPRLPSLPHFAGGSCILL